MPRVPGRRFPFRFAAMSLLILAIIVLWLSTFVTTPDVGWGDAVSGTRYTVALEPHRIGVTLRSGSRYDYKRPPNSYPEFPIAARWNRLGVSVLVYDVALADLNTRVIYPGRYGRTTELSVSLIYVLVLAAIPALVAWLRHRRKENRQARLAAGVCPDCGYDLRASPAHCPECGRLPTLSRSPAP